MAARRWGILLAAGSFVSCSGGSATEIVAIDVDAVSVTPTCVAVKAGDRVASVGPEGHLWLARAAGGSRVLNIDGTFVDTLLGFDQVTDAQAWDGATSSLIEAGELWTQIGETREHVPLPDEVGDAVAFCGDPSQPRGSFVAGSGGLYERATGFWWLWTPAGGDGFGAIRDLARVDGACSDDRDAVWLLNDDGLLWQIAADDAKIVGGKDSPIDQVAVARSIGVAAVAEGALSLGPSRWIDVVFEAGGVATIGAGSDAVWAVAGGSLYVRTPEAWRRVDTGDPDVPIGIHADAAGGAWLEYSEQVCHVALAEPIHIAGLRPFEHRLVTTATLDIATGESDLLLDRDDEEIASAAAVEGFARFADVDLGTAGWHTLRVRGVSGSSSRELDYFVIDVPEVSWDSDIAPVFEQFCAGSLCHGPTPEGSRVDLSSYQAWRGRAPLIRTRLLRGEMPPIDPRPPTDSINLILDWIEGGMKP